MNVLLFPLGSHGDVHPFVALALALRERGHRVTIGTNGHFEPLIRRHGFDFIELGTPEQYQETLRTPGVWEKPVRAIRLIVERLILDQMRPVYEQIAARHVPGETVVAAPMLAFGARLAEEKLGVPLVTVHLQPGVFRSLERPPALPGHPFGPDVPRWLMRLLYWYADAALLDPPLAPGVNAYRAELGLPPVRRRILTEWSMSPNHILGLFPDWFAPKQPDWPAPTRLTGFPLYDERDQTPMDPDVEAFLDAGPPPIVFTPGSAMCQAHAFFEESVSACRALGRRGMLLTMYPEHLPRDLPEGVRPFGYVPFSRLLPRAAAFVHHGGVGTTAQALAAGVPQLVVPMSFDQPDNAARVARLGVGRSLPLKQYRGRAVVDGLTAVLASPEIARRSREVAGRFEGVDPVAESCQYIEEAASLAPACV